MKNDEKVVVNNQAGDVFVAGIGWFNVAQTQGISELAD